MSVIGLPHRGLPEEVLRALMNSDGEDSDKEDSVNAISPNRYHRGEVIQREVIEIGTSSDEDDNEVHPYPRCVDVSQEDQGDFEDPLKDTVVHLGKKYETVWTIYHPGSEREALLASWNRGEPSAERNASIVPFIDNTCKRPNTKSQQGGVPSQFVLEAMKDAESTLLINSLSCKVDIGDEILDRPTAIGSFVITKGQWEGSNPKEAITAKASLNQLHIDKRLVYEGGRTWVVEIKLMCSQLHFRHAGKHMYNRILAHTRSHIVHESGGDDTGKFIVVLDSVPCTHTQEFYTKIGLNEAGKRLVIRRWDRGKEEPREYLYRYFTELPIAS